VQGSALRDRQHWPEVQVWAAYTETIPSDDLVQSVHVIALTGNAEIFICKDKMGNVFLPGGTREPGEPISHCAARELREEAGLTISGGIRWFGAHLADGYKSTPYRPHLPHPKKAWLWGVCFAVQDGPPTNPPGAEQVVSVMKLPLNEASTVMSTVKPWYPELLERAFHFQRVGKDPQGKPEAGC
jgi:8-oxo-dGTP diphosphatase